MNPRSLMRRLFPTSCRLLAERSLFSLALPEFDSVLVIGAGHDPYHKIFKRPKEYIRLDIESVPGITDVVADALSLPFEGNRFDCIFATEVMEHLSNPYIFAKEVGRVLKSGGTVVLTVPFMFHQHANPNDFWRPTDTALRDLFADFKEVTVTPHGNRLHVISDLVTTAFAGFPVFFPLRIFNHILGAFPVMASKPSTAPSGYLLVGVK